MKHLVDIDDTLLQQAQAYLGTPTIKGTVEEALRIVTEQRRDELVRAWERFGQLAAEMPLADRSEAW